MFFMRKISIIILLFAALISGILVYSNKLYFMSNSLSLEYRFLFWLIYLIIFTPLPYLSYRNKRYKVFLTFAISSLFGFVIAIIDPLDLNGGNFNGLVFQFAIMFIVIPAHIIGLISWIFVSWVRWDKKDS